MLLTNTCDSPRTESANLLLGNLLTCPLERPIGVQSPRRLLLQVLNDILPLCPEEECLAICLCVLAPSLLSFFLHNFIALTSLARSDMTRGSGVICEAPLQ